MEILISLWSYDDRWMFQQKFRQSIWYITSALTGLIGLSSLYISISIPELSTWAGFHILICIGSCLTSFILALNHNSAKHQRKSFYLTLLLAFLGLINLSSTPILKTIMNSDLSLSVLAKVQIAIYYYSLIHVFGIVLCFFVIKLFVLFMAFAKPSYLVRIRSKV